MIMKKASKEEIQKELVALKSSLPRSQQGAGFVLPEAYFDELPQRVQALINKNKPRVIHIGQISVYKKHALTAMAATLMILATAGWLVMKKTPYTDNLALHDAFWQFDYFAWHNNTSAFDLYDILLETDISAEEILYGMHEQRIDDQDDAIYDYLEYTLENETMHSEIYHTLGIQ